MAAGVSGRACARAEDRISDVALKVNGSENETVREEKPVTQKLTKQKLNNVQ